MKKHDNIVYSTDDNYLPSKEEIDSTAIEIPPEKQALRLHLQRLPGNRIITIVKGFIGRDEVLIDLSK